MGLYYEKEERMSESNTGNLKQQTKKGLYWSFFNQFANYGMQFCVGIVMARMLSPSDYGITALPAVFMAVALILQNAGLADALVRKKDLTEEDLSTSFYYSIAVPPPSIFGNKKQSQIWLCFFVIFALFILCNCRNNPAPERWEYPCRHCRKSDRTESPPGR